MSEANEELECMVDGAPEEQSRTPDEFLAPYATAELRDAYERRSTGDAAAAMQVRSTLRQIVKQEDKPLTAYLKAPNENPTLEQYRKRYHRMQRLSWVALVLCAVLTVGVMLCLLMKPELLLNKTRDLVICAVAVLFSVLTWTFSSISGHCVKRMVEVELALRVLALPEAPDEEAPAEDSQPEDDEAPEQTD